MLTADEIRQKYLEFFQERGHKIIPPAPLVLENDPTTLFTSSGMQPLVPYLLGQPHPEGTRLVDSQPSFRSQDIEEVGDNRHTTFFEMLGNWSLGDYFKKEQLSWFYEFLTSELNLPKEKLYVSVFEGDKDVPRDEESASIWKNLGVAADHIYYYGVKKNWWSRSGTPDQMPAGEPGGPDSEVFFEFTQVDHDPKFGEKCHPNCDCGRFLEIGNSVFMQYQKQTDGTLKELSQKNVDFGGGLERLEAAVRNDPDVFNGSLLKPLMEVTDSRIIADHMKAATFLVKNGVLPANKQHGYLLRRLIRRSAIKAREKNIDLSKLPDIVVRLYPKYLNSQDLPLIRQVVSEELTKFEKTLDEGLKKLDQVSAFDLYQSYGFPKEVIQELYQQRGIQFNEAEFEDKKKQHQESSRTASKGMFKGGLEDQSEITTKYHTATHLLHAALRKVLGEHVQQKGSNITAERLRFDFSHPQKLTPEQIDQISTLINQRIEEDLPVQMNEMDKQRALDEGALAFFPEKYPVRTTVYTIGDFSKELCGGPHVSSTGMIGRIKIIKEEAVAAGVRRIYAQLA
jgi:alanyl-tRNA synthetase